MSTAALTNLSASEKTSELSSIENEIRQLAELLPSQGPITAFAFLNPLQGMEDQPFADALRQVKDVFGCEPFLQEAAYRQKLAHGRITVEDLREVMEGEPGFRSECAVAGCVRRGDLRLSMLEHAIMPGNDNELRWIIAESDALRTFRAEISHDVRDRLLEETQHWVMRDLWTQPEHPRPEVTAELTAVIQKTVSGFGRKSIENWPEKTWEHLCLSLLWSLAKKRMATAPPPPRSMHREVRHRDLLLDVIRVDTDVLVDEVLVKFCAAYLDQGYAPWRLPDRDSGFLASFCELYESGVIGNHRWLKPLAGELRQLRASSVTSLQSIADSLAALGIDSSDRYDFLRSTILALRGWAGMIWQTEVRPDRVYRSSPPGTFPEFLAIRLILDRLAVASVAKETAGLTLPLDQLRDVVVSSRLAWICRPPRPWSMFRSGPKIWLRPAPSTATAPTRSALWDDAAGFADYTWIVGRS